MTIEQIFQLQFMLSLLLWSMIAKWLFAPALRRKATHEALFLLTIPHAFRYIGMVFLVPGVVSDGLPGSFATFAAYGDLATGLIAMLALVALRYKWVGAIAIVWLFNVLGLADLLKALPQTHLAPHFEAAWYIPTFLVPLLLVTHFMMFARLIKERSTKTYEAQL